MILACSLFFLVRNDQSEQNLPCNRNGSSYEWLLIFQLLILYTLGSKFMALHISIRNETCTSLERLILVREMRERQRKRDRYICNLVYNREMVTEKLVHAKFKKKVANWILKKKNRFNISSLELVSKLMKYIQINMQWIETLMCSHL